MGNVNEAHERETESSDDIDTSSSECDSSSRSATTSSDQDIAHMSEDVRLDDSIINTSLEISPTSSDHSELDNNLVNEALPDADSIEHSANNASSDSLPLSESILPASFDLLEESIGDLVFDNVQDGVLTPDASYDLERKADSPPNTHIGFLPQIEGEERPQTQDNFVLCVANEILPKESHLSNIIAETILSQMDAEPQAFCPVTVANKFQSVKTVQRVIEVTCGVSSQENSTFVKSSSSILNGVGPFIACINPDKSESGMTSLAEHFDAISLEEPQIQPLERKNLGHAIEKDSDHALAEASHDQIFLDAADPFLPSEVSTSQSDADISGFTSGGLTMESHELPSSHIDLLDDVIQKMPLLQFDLSEGNLTENRNPGIITAKDACSVPHGQMEPALVLHEELLTLNDGCEAKVLNNEEPTCLTQVEQALTKLVQPGNLFTGVKAHSPPRHTADRPNWALAPDLPLKSQSSSSVKRRKRGPRRGKRTANDTSPASPDALKFLSKQRNSSPGSEGAKQSRKYTRPLCDLSKAMDIRNVDSSNDVISTLHTTEQGFMPVQTGYGPEIIAETSHSSHQAHTVKPSPASEHGVATAMASVGSPVGLPSMDPGEANTCHDTTENGLDRTVSSTFSVTPYISGERLPNSSWLSLEEEVRFHAINRSFQSAVHHASKSFSPEKMPITTVCETSFREQDPVLHRTGDNGPDSFTAVTKTRHAVVDESIAIPGEGSHNARVNIPTNRPETIDFRAHLDQGATHPSRPPFQSGIPVPSRGQFHRNSYINLPRSRASRLSVPEEIVHDVSSQTSVSQNASRTCSLSQINRTISQPFMIRHPIATSSHPNGPVPTISSNRDPILLPEPSSRPPNTVPASRYPVRPRANPPHSYSTSIINIHENRWEHSRYQPHFESAPHTEGFRPHREGHSVNGFYSSGPGSSNVQRRLN